MKKIPKKNRKELNARPEVMGTGTAETENLMTTDLPEIINQGLNVLQVLTELTVKDLKEKELLTQTDRHVEITMINPKQVAELMMTDRQGIINQGLNVLQALTELTVTGPKEKGPLTQTDLQEITNPEPNALQALKNLIGTSLPEIINQGLNAQQARINLIGISLPEKDPLLQTDPKELQVLPVEKIPLPLQELQNPKEHRADPKKLNFL